MPQATPEPPLIVARTASCRDDAERLEQRPIRGWSTTDAYVLLGEPGGGKTTAFLAEKAAAGDSGVYVRARDLINAPQPDWRDKTLFIDALDVVRAGAGTPMAAIDDIVKTLGMLGKPRFRLACREAEWLRSDRAALEAVAPGGHVSVLQLDALTEADQDALLSDRGVIHPDWFRLQAQHNGVDAFLNNPLRLDMLAKAVAAGQDWPTRRETLFRNACRQMADEHDDTMRDATHRRQAPIDSVLHDAGLLCALHLLADVSGFTAYAFSAPDLQAGPMALTALPTALGLRDAAATLKSKLFVTEAGHVEPRHRSIASYLAATVLAARIDRDLLPVNRVLAWISGADGGIVEPLRELAAWLGALSAKARSALIACDPLGCLLYGDAQAMGTEDRRALLAALRSAADAHPRFRYAGVEWGHIPEQPFGVLAVQALLPDLLAVLTDPDRSAAHQAHLDCVLDGLRYGDKLPTLLAPLLSIVRDTSDNEDNRVAALQAWLVTAGAGHSQAVALLADLQSGTVADPNDRMLGHLLLAMYPAHLSVADVMRYFKLRPQNTNFGMYGHFWADTLIPRTPTNQHGTLADGLVALQLDKRGVTADYSAAHWLLQIIVAALQAHGVTAPAAQLVAWLELGLDEHDWPLDKHDQQAAAIRNWLEHNPAALERAYRHVVARIDIGDAAVDRAALRRCGAVLHGARVPSGWPQVQLDIASNARSAVIAEDAFVSAAGTALRGHGQFGITRREIVAWLAGNATRWPQAKDWLVALKVSRAKYQRQELQRLRRDAADKLHRERRQRQAFLQDLQCLTTGQRPSDWFVAQVSRAYRPQESRPAQAESTGAVIAVQQHLLCNHDDAQAAVAAVRAVLQRDDLPDVAAILATFHGGHFYLQSACLLAADLAATGDSVTPLGWNDGLARRLVAFHLVAQRGRPDWFATLARQRPALVAEVVLAHALPLMPGRGRWPGGLLWDLYRDEHFAPVALLVLPPLLAALPHRLPPQRVFDVGVALINAAQRHMSADDVQAIAAQRRAMPVPGAIDSTQWMAWTLVAARHAPRQRLRDLALCVGGSKVRWQRLVQLLNTVSRAGLDLMLPVAALAGLMTLVGPQASTDRISTASGRHIRDSAGDVVHMLIQQLQASDDDAAEGEFTGLMALPALQAWRPWLIDALHARRRGRRTERHRYPDAQHIATALGGGAPVNVPDLAALLVDLLADAQRDWRGREGRQLEVFWCDPVQQQRRRPRIENECRNRLHALLRPQLLARGIDLPLEPQHADDTRADLGLCWADAGRALRLPVEIKCESHKRVWMAWADQLERYAAHPDSDGIGVYVVLWFGHAARKAPGAAKAPADAGEMQGQLQALIPPIDRHRLPVVVLDLSLPGHPPWHPKKAPRR